MRLWLFGLLTIVSVAQADGVAVNNTESEDASGLVQVEVSIDDNDTYHFNMQFIAHANPQQVIAIITDYQNLTRLNPLIKQTRILPHSEHGVTRVELITEGCMFFFCKKVTRVEDAQINNDLTIETQFVPELSDFKSGQTYWTFTATGERTLVNYQASMVPDFWLPPFVGPYMLKKQLFKQLNYTANKINQILLTHDN